MEMETKTKNILDIKIIKHDDDNVEIEQPTQFEMKNILISKLQNYKNVDIKIKECTNNVGIFYAITVHIKLSEFGNGIFHSATLKTVSYNKRTVEIKCVFADNENLIRDMKINRDSVFQCFRDIASSRNIDTITSISLEDFKDQSDKSHLRIIASTIKRSSLIFVYKRLIDFVTIINEKYGNLINTVTLPNPIPVQESKPVPIIPKPVQESNPVPIIPKPVQESNHIPVNSNPNSNTCISNHTIAKNIIKDLDAEEKRLQIILDNIKLLKQTQINCLNNTKEKEKVQEKVPIVVQTTFASKVKQSLNK